MIQYFMMIRDNEGFPHPFMDNDNVRLFNKEEIDNPIILNGVTVSFGYEFYEWEEVEVD